MAAKKKCILLPKKTIGVLNHVLSTILQNTDNNLIVVYCTDRSAARHDQQPETVVETIERPGPAFRLRPHAFRHNYFVRDRPAFIFVA
jgi:hypothetical protein